MRLESRRKAGALSPVSTFSTQWATYRRMRGKTLLTHVYYSLGLDLAKTDHGFTLLHFKFSLWF